MQHTLPLRHARRANLRQVGGKAASLGEMISEDLPVPDGFVVTVDAYRAHAPKELPIYIIDDILSQFDELGAGNVAVRSSAIAEDGANESYAGMFETIIDVDRANLIESIYKCWKSANSERVNAYSNNPTDIAVVIQKMVDADAAGVMFTANPISGSRNDLIIEAVRGNGEALVSGRATPDHYTLSRSDLSLVDQELTEDSPILSAAQLGALAGLALTAETYFGFPLDIEWAIENDTLYLLQGRPITTL